MAHSISMTWSDGFEHDFHALWLRENSSSPEVRDPTTQHKTELTAFLPLGLSIVRRDESDDAISLEFSDGHVAEFTKNALREAAEHPWPKAADDCVYLNQSSSSDLLWFELEQVVCSGGSLLRFLNHVARHGIGLIRGLSLEPEGIRHLTDHIGYIRYTNSGGISDVRSVSEAYDLSMTTRGLEPHVDNPYRDPQPGYTLLHCIRNDAAGGDSVLIDGFAVAEVLREEDPSAFESLCKTQVVFRYQDEQAILRDAGSMIEVWPDGSLRHVRFHGRADQVPALGIGELEAFYMARRKLADLIWSPRCSIQFKLQPGEMYFVDNFRFLHGRTAFSLETGERHMRQAYMDRDVVFSRRNVLAVNDAAPPWQPRIHD